MIVSPVCQVIAEWILTQPGLLLNCRPCTELVDDSFDVWHRAYSKKVPSAWVRLVDGEIWVKIFSTHPELGANTLIHQNLILLADPDFLDQLQVALQPIYPKPGADLWQNPPTGTTRSPMAPRMRTRHTTEDKTPE